MLQAQIPPSGIDSIHVSFGSSSEDVRAHKTWLMWLPVQTVWEEER